MADEKTLAQFSGDLAAIRLKLDVRVLEEIPRGDHLARAQHHAGRAAVYREIEALFQAVLRSPLAGDLVLLFAASHAEDHYREWAEKYEQWAANATRRAGGGR